MFFSAADACHYHQVTEYNNNDASKSWRIEKRTSGAFAGYYRLVNMVGGQTLCADVDVDDSIDNGNEYTTTPYVLWGAGVFTDTCVGDSHAEVASQSVIITKLPNKGAWGKDTYTITFVESAANDARQVYLSVTNRLTGAGQRVLTDNVHEYSTLYFEEQLVPMDTPARFIAPLFDQTPSLDGKKVQIYHYEQNALACLEANLDRSLGTATCETTVSDGQTWTLQKRTTRRYAGYYQLVNGIGSLCLTHAEWWPNYQYQTLMAPCLSDKHLHAYERTYGIEPSGNGYLITKVHPDDGYKWLVTNRSGKNTVGSIDLIDKETAVRSNAVWHIKILPDTD